MKKRSSRPSRTISKDTRPFYVKYSHYLIPSLIGGAIAWIASGSFELALVVFAAAWVGNCIGYTMRKALVKAKK